ncbi:MAG: prephenate dehydratase [Acidobacteriota bacterium]|nr:prephenate dehydratase [Acidobacteriota bacterium]
MDLNDLRKAIDDIDDSLLDLLNQRATFVMEVGRIKSKEKKGFFVPSRERAIFERLARRNKGPFTPRAIENVYREIISASINLEHPIHVCYLGPQATFTHAAAIKQFGNSSQLMAERSISSVFEEVESGRATYGVVPIENSNEGAVTHTLDNFIHNDLKVVAETYLEISHDLLSMSGEMSHVKRIYSHPQAIEQCRRWLESNCPNVPIQEVASTAGAAQLVTNEADAAAIAGQAAARTYGLKQVAPRIEDNHQNYTRFLIIGNEVPPPTGRDKTSVLFSFSDQPGILARMLEPFRKRDLNLAKIESRPVKRKAWEYVFYLDIEGHIDDDPIANAIAELKDFCHLVKHLGSYPRAR